MNGNKKLIQALNEINYLSRFTSLRNRHDNISSSLDKPEIQKVQKHIESFGYKVRYNKGHKFFKIIDNYNINTTLHFAVEYGKAEFILNYTINGDASGDTFSNLSHSAGSEERIKNPFFSNYDELRIILEEGFSIWEDLKKVLEEKT